MPKKHPVPHKSNETGYPRVQMDIDLYAVSQTHDLQMDLAVGVSGTSL